MNSPAQLTDLRRYILFSFYTQDNVVTMRRTPWTTTTSDLQQRDCQDIADDVVPDGPRHTVAGRRVAGGRRSVTSDRFVAVFDASSSKPRHDVQLPTSWLIVAYAFARLPPPATHR